VNCSGGRDLALTMDGDYVQSAGAQQFRSNRDLSLAVTGDITNTSTFEAAGTLTLSGQQIVNQGGTIAGGDVVLSAQGDIRNETLVVKQTYDFGQNSGSYTSLSNVASITATGKLDITAGRDLSDLAGVITAGSATITAGRDVSFNTVQTGSTYQSQISGFTQNDSAIRRQEAGCCSGAWRYGRGREMGRRRTISCRCTRSYRGADRWSKRCSGGHLKRTGSARNR